MSDESVVHYVTWDYERGKKIGYERHGECLRCGRCCYDQIHIRGRGGKEPMRTVVDKSGVWYECPDDDKRSFYKVESVDITGIACSCLTDDKLCDSRGNGKYAQICQDWPVSPDHQILWPNCGYSFVEVGRWSIDELVLNAGAR